MRCESNHRTLNFVKNGIIGFRCALSGVERGEQKLSNVSSTKFLGPIVDEDIKFIPHILVLSRRV